MQNSTETYTELFTNNLPLMDVRAPIEYERGAFPHSENLPIMDDLQREEVGTCYKHHGQEKAIEKGHELVQGKVREMRINAWLEFAKQHPNGYLYCFRGGLRSKIAQQWMRDSGVDLPIIQGGYKALRTILLNELENVAKQYSFKLIGGKTGCGKTTLVNNLAHGIDLEAAAYHRGSSFGRHAKEQNNQINFENILAIDFLKLRQKQIKNIFLEDEARTIGKVGLPKALFEKMRKSPIVVIEDPYTERIERLIQEYVVDMTKEFETMEGQAKGFILFSNYLLDSLERINKRLGPARYGGIRKMMQAALSLQAKSGDIAKHYDWLSCNTRKLL